MTIARINQQTALRRHEAQGALQQAKDAAAMARLLAEQGGENARESAKLATDIAIQQARAAVALIGARTDAARFGEGRFGPNIDDESQRLLTEAEKLIETLSAGVPAPKAVTSAAPGSATETPEHKEGAIVTAPDGRRGRIVRNPQTGALEVELIQ